MLESCFNCLKRVCTASNCNYRGRCKTDGCLKKHNTLLHVSKPEGANFVDTSAETYSETEELSNDEMINSSVNANRICASALLKVIPKNVVAPEAV